MSYDVDIYESMFDELSDKGKLCSEKAEQLSKKEIAGLREDGFSVFPLDASQSEALLDVIPCNVDWSKPFHDPISADTANAIIAYIQGVIDCIPRELNLAQRFWLYAIRVRVKNNNE